MKNIANEIEQLKKIIVLAKSFFETDSNVSKGWKAREFFTIKNIHDYHLANGCGYGGCNSRSDYAPKFQGENG